MPRLTFGNVQAETQDGETALDALLREGAAIPHACKAGACGSCLVRAIPASSAPAAAQAGLKESWKAQGYLLACLCRPDADLALEPPGADARQPARIASLDWLSHDVLRVRLTIGAGAAFEFRAGQYLTLHRPEDGLARSYSIASLPGDNGADGGGGLELHVRCIPGGRMSGWLSTEAAPGAPLEVTGPSGECFYVPGREDQPLLLAGTGTGLAPLWGIVRDALAHGHRGPIHLFHGAVRPEGLYLREELTRLAATLPLPARFTYTPTVLDAPEPGMAAGAIDRVVLSRFPDLDGWRGFVCGDPALVATLKRKLFLAGMAFTDIHADAFLPSVA